MSGYHIREATQEDNAGLLALCKIPQGDNIKLSLERVPDFFTGARIQCEEVEVYICMKIANPKIYGVFSVGKRRVYYNNEIKCIRYFSDLRIHPDLQGSRLLYHIGRFIIDNKILQDGFAQTIVFGANNTMLKLLESLQYHSKKLSLFRFYPAGNFNCYLVKFMQPSQNSKPRCIIRKAELKDIPQIHRLMANEGTKKNLFPHYELTLLGSGYYEGLSIENFYVAIEKEEIVGLAATWDQHNMKQTRIFDYSTLYQKLRPFINLYHSFAGGFKLPAKGTIVNYLTIHTTVIKENNVKIFKSLLHQINVDNRMSGYNYFMVGLDAKDILNDALKKFRNKRLITGKHFLVAEKGIHNKTLINSLFYLETARI